MPAKTHFITTPTTKLKKLFENVKLFVSRSCSFIVCVQTMREDKTYFSCVHYFLLIFLHKENNRTDNSLGDSVISTLFFTLFITDNKTSHITYMVYISIW